MYLIAIAWGYVVLMMTAAEATAANGSVLGALITLLLYGVLPLSLLTYIMGTPGRKRRRKAADIEAERQAATAPSALPPDCGSHAAGAAVSAEGKEA
jgi:membrane protein implicated in regulation of membrane protease activity